LKGTDPVPFKRSVIYLACFLWLAESLLTCAVAARATPDPEVDIRYTTEPMRVFFSIRDTFSGWIEVPGRGEMFYYAQNDPRWDQVKYNEVNKLLISRTIGESGCAPTAFSIFLRNVAPYRKLYELFALSAKGAGYPFCICSCQKRYCTGAHERFIPWTVEDLADYLPIVIASYIGGNNQNGQKGTPLMRSLLTKLSIPFTYTTKREDVLEALRNGAVVLANSGTTSSPFTNNGHYIVLASLYNGYIYILEPYVRTDYGKLDRKHILEIVQPGLVRALEGDFARLCCTGYVIAYPDR